MVYLGNYYEWDASTNTPTKYYYAGSQRIAMRTGTGSGATGLKWLLTDHLGSTSITADGASGAKLSELRYKPWGSLRYASQPTPTGLRFTGQRMEGIGLYDYGARWYDSSLGRFIQADSIVSGVGESRNPNAVGYLGAATYSPLTVDYHENQFLDQLNTENRARFHDSNFKLPPVPTNSIAFDRYAYSLNNPIRYTDPTGHCIFCLALPFLGVPGVGWVIVGGAVAATVIYYTAGGPEAVANGLDQAGEAVSDGLNAIFASRYAGDPRTAGDIIGQDKQGRIKGEFPSELLGKTYDEIVDLAKRGKGAIRDKARTAKKLLDSHEYDKDQKR